MYFVNKNVGLKHIFVLLFQDGTQLKSFFFWSYTSLFSITAASIAKSNKLCLNINGRTNEVFASIEGLTHRDQISFTF